MSRLLEHFLVNDNVEEFHLQAKKIQATLSNFHSDGHTSRFPFLTYFKVNLIVGFRFAVDTIARNVASCNIFHSCKLQRIADKSTELQHAIVSHKCLYNKFASSVYEMRRQNVKRIYLSTPTSSK